MHEQKESHYFSGLFEDVIDKLNFMKHTNFNF